MMVFGLCESSSSSLDLGESAITSVRGVFALGLEGRTFSVASSWEVGERMSAMMRAISYCSSKNKAEITMHRQFTYTSGLPFTS